MDACITITVFLFSFFVIVFLTWMLAMFITEKLFLASGIKSSRTNTNINTNPNTPAIKETLSTALSHTEQMREKYNSIFVNSVSLTSSKTSNLNKIEQEEFEEFYQRLLK